MQEQQFQSRLLDPQVREPYSPLDYTTVRERMFDNTKRALVQRFPLDNERYRLELEDADYDGKRDFSLAEQRKAILENRTLAVPLKGRWRLVDAVTGDTVDKTNRRVVMNVPYLTERGTFIRNGHEVGLNYMMRLQPGVYTRVRGNGLYEAHVNPEQGSGQQFKMELDPESGIFNIRRGYRKYHLYPLLKAAGVTDDELAASWGKDLLAVNRAAIKYNAHRQSIKSPVSPMYKNAQDAEGLPVDPAELDDEEPVDVEDLPKDKYAELLEELRKNKVNPGATELTLGRRYEQVTPDLLINTSNKLLRLSKDQATPDYRDSLQYQTVMGPAEYLAERIVKDGGRVGRNLLWRATNKTSLDKIPSGALNRHIDSLFNESRHSYYVEGSSPFEAIDGSTRITRLGEGGIAGVRTAPAETRDVQDTYKGFIDPVRSVESLRVGLDMHLSESARIGDDGRLYNTFVNAKTGKKELIDSLTASRAIVSTPDQMDSKDAFVPAFVGDEGIQYVPKKSVQYYLSTDDEMFSLGSNLVPLKGATMSNRLLMGSKYLSQALPLVNREAPLVRTAKAGGGSYEAMVGEKMGARRASSAGTVESVSKDAIKIKRADGEIDNYELYNNFPANHKGYVRSIPTVTKGASVKPGQLLAHTNYTDDQGDAAVGVNLKTAYLNWRGVTFEDAVAISESAARKLTSEHMYKQRLPVDPSVSTDPKAYKGLFPGRFTTEQLKHIGDDGMAKSGTKLNRGDPVAVAIRTREPSPGSLGRRMRTDDSLVWDHDYEGVVVDSVSGDDYHSVYIRSNAPAEEGDKLTIRAGGKGIISSVIPDSQMPLDANGEPFEQLLSPLGIISRTNPSQLIETVMGKVAKKTGKPVYIESFPKENIAEWAKKQLAQNELSPEEDVVDPASGKTIPKVLTGYLYSMKVKHTAEGKLSGRGAGQGYTVDELPMSGGPEGSKRLGSLESSAVAGHGAMQVLRDAKLVRGQRNDDYWRDFRMGKTPKEPGMPLVHKKFFAHLEAAGLSLKDRGRDVELFAMTDADAKKLSGGRELASAETYDAKTFSPKAGGLFDPKLFGDDGDEWAYMQLPEPLPNPLMEDALAASLNISPKIFNEILSGKRALPGATKDPKTGPPAIMDGLKKVNLEGTIASSLKELKTGSPSSRDKALKRYRLLMGMKLHNRQPADFMMTRIPVLPPKYRPITPVGDVNIAADANYLYKEMIQTRQDIEQAKDVLPEDRVREMEAQMYDRYKALVGLADPDSKELQEKNVGGMLKWAFGKGAPKYGGYQHKVLGSHLDTVGRGVVVPDPKLKLDELGIPEAMAWEIFEPYVVRELSQKGSPTTSAVRMVADRHQVARKALMDVMAKRPVLMNRAPTLHRFGIMAFQPKLVAGKVIRVSPSIVKPLNMDFDGDAANIHVPASPEAVEEAYRKMMPHGRNLFTPRSDTAHYKPMAEYAHGLYLATRVKSGEKATKVFETDKQAVQAYRRGEIDIDTPVKVLRKEKDGK